MGHNIIGPSVRLSVRPFDFSLKGLQFKLYIYLGTFVTYCDPILVLFAILKVGDVIRNFVCILRTAVNCFIIYGNYGVNPGYGGTDFFLSSETAYLFFILEFRLYLYWLH